MPHSDLPFRALSVLHSARYLFNKYGFHNVGIDRIIESAKIPKATFYNYFHSKERLIEMSLTFQKDGLKHEVISIIHVQKELTLVEKLRKIYYLHADLDELYHLPFKAIFEIAKTHHEAFLSAEKYQFYDTNALVLNRLLPVIKATYDDLYNGFLITFKQIVQAEVFDSELEQAKSLLENGYKNAAAVIAGVVLETAIKELCLNNNIDTERKKLTQLNDDLAKDSVYNKLQQKQITALADIRNNAAHGNYDQFTREDVERMISDIERFLLNYAS